LAENAFLPNYFVDITPFLKDKLALLDIYASEMGEHPFPRSRRNVEALAVFRGASCGATYAEAFQLLKFIDK
jgi:N-acetylglucosamine malate deacetylase 1